MATPSDFEKDFEAVLSSLTDRERAAEFKGTYMALVAQKTHDAEYLEGGKKAILKMMDEGREESEKEILNGGRQILSSVQRLLKLNEDTPETKIKSQGIEANLQYKMNDFQESFKKIAEANSTGLALAYDGLIKGHEFIVDGEIKRLLLAVLKYKNQEVCVRTRSSI